MRTADWRVSSVPELRSILLAEKAGVIPRTLRLAEHSSTPDRQDGGVELYVHHLDRVTYIKDDVGTEYPLLGVEWAATADELADIVRRAKEAALIGGAYFSQGGRRFGCRIVGPADDIIELRFLESGS